MRRIVIWLASTVTVVVLLFGYHTSTNSTPIDATSGSPTTGSPTTGSPTTGSPTTGSPTTSPTEPSRSATRKSTIETYTGDVAQTRWGPVQVKITVASGKITTVDVVKRPSDNPRDVEINDRALPVLVQDTLDAQSAQIDMVSGATVTSGGYVRSLQSALDQAGI